MNHCQCCTAPTDAGVNLCATCKADIPGTTAKLEARIAELAKTATEEERAKAGMIAITADALLAQGCACVRCREPLAFENASALATKDATLFVVVCPKCLGDRDGTGEAIDAAATECDRIAN